MLNPQIVAPPPIIDVIVSAVNANVTYTIEVSGTGLYIVDITAQGLGQFQINDGAVIEVVAFSSVPISDGGVIEVVSFSQ